MHTQKKWCACVHTYDGYYLTIVKKNQPQMYEDLVDFFDDPDAEQEEWQYSKRVQKKHGRLEIRELWASTQMNEWFETQWAGVAQVFRIRRQVKDGDKAREEIVYGLTNLPRKKANASRLLALQQAHWRIENRLHRRRDVTLGEDACQVRMTGAGFRVGCSQWRRPRLDGLAPCAQCGFPDAPFLRPSRGSLALTVWQAFAVARVNRKALLLLSSLID
jgi:predicted transposase YbfD/YdcC